MALFKRLSTEDIDTELDQATLDLSQQMEVEIAIEHLITSTDRLISRLELQDEVAIAAEELDLLLPNNISIEAANHNYNLWCYKYDEDISTEQLSIEAIVDRKHGVGDLATKVVSQFKDFFDHVTSVPALFRNYNVDKLQNYKELITSGVLVKRTVINKDDLAAFNDKMAVFFAFGNKLDSNVSDFIKYLNDPIVDINSGKYDHLIKDGFKALMRLGHSDEVKKSFINIDLHKLKFKLKDGVEDNLVLGFLVKRFYHKLYLTTVIEGTPSTVDRGEDGTFSSYHPFGINIDIENISSSSYGSIVPLDKNEIIKLLDYGISSKSDISKALSNIKTKLLVHTVIDVAISKLLNIYASFFAAAGLGSLGAVNTIAMKIFITRLYRSITIHIANLNKDIVKYDKLILEYINLTYEKK